MSTLLQKELATAIIHNAKTPAHKKKNKKELLVSAGYAIKTAEATPQRILEQKGVQEELIMRGFSVENAKRVVGELLDDDSVFPRDRINAAKEVFAVSGAYAPSKSINMNINVEELQNEITAQIARFRAKE